MKIKTTEEIVDWKEKLISRHYKKSNDWTQEIEKIMLKKWVAIDEVIEIIEKVMRMEADFDTVLMETLTTLKEK